MFPTKLEGLLSSGDRCVSAGLDALLPAHAPAVGDFSSGISTAEVSA